MKGVTGFVISLFLVGKLGGSPEETKLTVSRMKGLAHAVLLGSAAEEPQGRMRRPQSVHKAATYVVTANTTHLHPQRGSTHKKNKIK